jgi:hypothetical protein
MLAMQPGSGIKTGIYRFINDVAVPQRPDHHGACPAIPFVATAFGAPEAQFLVDQIQCAQSRGEIPVFCFPIQEKNDADILMNAAIYQVFIHILTSEAISKDLPHFVKRFLSGISSVLGLPVAVPRTVQAVAVPPMSILTQGYFRLLTRKPYARRYGERRYIQRAFITEKNLTWINKK